MEKMNDNVPFEHQMMFIIRDYDKKVEEIHELRREADELSLALDEQGKELSKVKAELYAYRKMACLSTCPVGPQAKQANKRYRNASTYRKHTSFSRNPNH